MTIDPHNIAVDPVMLSSICVECGHHVNQNAEHEKQHGRINKCPQCGGYCTPEEEIIQDEIDAILELTDDTETTN